MKRKYLAIVLSLSMVFSVVSPVMASSDELQMEEEVSEDSLADDESVVSVSLEEDAETVETDSNEEQDNVESAQFSDETGNFDDGSEATLAVGTDETADAEWTSLKNESSISFKYDESNKTLYFKCSGTAALPDNDQSGSTAQWAVALKEKTSDVEKVVIGEGITKVGNNNFSNKLSDWPSLKEVELASTVISIGDSAFYKDSNLKTINLNQIDYIGMYGMAETGIEQVALDKEQVSIGELAFEKCLNLKSVSVKGITSWNDASFSGCTNLTSFQCEKSIEVIPTQTFKDCGALSTCSIVGVKEVGTNAFRSCTSLNEFDFSNVETLKAGAFRQAGLTKISFSNKSITIESRALLCSNLTSVCYPGSKEEWERISSNAKVPDTTVVHCKADTVEVKVATCTEAGWKEVGVCEVCGEHYSYPTDENAIPATGHTWSEDYVVDKEATCTEAGEKSKHCTVCGVKNEEDVQKIPAAGHKFSDWKVTSEATVFAAEKQERTCATCGAKETRTNGTVLEPTVSVNASNVKLKVKQTTTGLKVTGLAKGDSVKTWKSTNKKIFTVKGKANGTCKLTAKKAGTAKLQITLVSGKQKTIKVKVQKSAVKTTKLTVANKKVTVQKGKKTTLKAVVTPFTSGQKVTYTSSNKKIATVSSKGVVTGKKKGTVKITVKSGSKSVKVTVRVK